MSRKIYQHLTSTNYENIGTKIQAAKKKSKPHKFSTGNSNRTK